MGTATAALTTIGIGSVSAETPDGFDKLTDSEATEVYERLQDTPEFRKLEREVRKEGNTLADHDITAGRVDGKDRLELVSVPIAGSSADEAYLTIGRSLDSAEVTIASLEYVERSIERPSADVQSIDDVEGTITARVVDALDGMEETVHDVSLDPSGPAAESDEISVAFDIGCAGCKTAVKQICRIGCGASTAFICGVLTGLGYITGGACFAFTQAACAAISQVGCDSPAEDICTHPKLDLC
ncbi:hypothetical protein HTG_17945 [Natrinema mahii]|nr:hypothetical protein HTG_17945 [Natrinema mahii]